jgi:hypothetical protein
MGYEQEIRNRFLANFAPVLMHRDGRTVPVIWHRSGVLRWVIQTPAQRWRELDIISKDAATLAKAGRELNPRMVEVLDMVDGLLYRLTWSLFMEYGESHGSQVAGTQIFVPRRWFSTSIFMPPAPSQSTMTLG